MNLTNLIRITVVTVIIVCATTFQANAMMAPYLASLIGDTCFAAGFAAIRVQKESTTMERVKWLNQGVKLSQINQLIRDAEKVAPYAPVLMPLGAVLSVGSRMSMFSKGGGKGAVLALLSIPINWALFAGGYIARLEQAPDATLLDRGADEGLSLYKRLTGRRKDR